MQESWIAEAMQMSLADTTSHHLNQGLFSDYYLNDVIPTRDDWLTLENEAREVRGKLQNILADVDTAALDEAQLEEWWIKPVLNALEHHYAVQVKIRYRRKGYRKPDYMLAPTPQVAARYGNKIYGPDQLQGLLAVCDAKKQGVNLDQAGKDERNPSQQIDEYLRYSELPWGILTDGQFWRLYERETSKNNIYYAVDLFDLLNQESIEPFLYFYAFFRQKAFISGFLTDVLEGSSEYAQQVGDQLEEQVYEALELIAQGFLSYRRNKLSPSPATLHTIYEESLVFLYRLLFILYAESREILPMRENTAYREQFSLASIKKEATRLNGQSLHPDQSLFYAKLKDLFYAIDQGDPNLALPAYNGGLFSEDKHPFLAANTIGDKYLVPAIDRITRVEVKDPQDPKRTKREFVDYRDLEVRHLGAIYEKLLEYQLDIAEEPLTIKRDKYTPAGPNDEVVKQPGEVLLRTGSNERKVTGSYYTPDYIVRFIVERTLTPLLEEITQQYATMSEEGDWQIKPSQETALREAILSVNILDPATGSGHFLVEATNYMAEWLRDLPIHPPGIESDEDELAFWKRQAVNTSMYGVDINPLAVELAKLSLWLTTLAKGKPLSFLDHHIKAGNSLVGAWAREVGVKLLTTPEQERKRQRKSERAETVGQLGLFTDDVFSPAMSFAVEEMAAIEHMVADTVQDVKDQQQRYEDLLERVKPWEQLADVYTARYFGLRMDQDDWSLVRTYLLNGEDAPTEDARQRLDTILGQTAGIETEQRFLHWELAFPEVFYTPSGEPKENPGFDTVVGNPPYVRQERIQPYKDFLSLKYQVYSGTADLFLYFFELGLRSLRHREYLGYITSGTYYNSNSAKPFREYIDQSAAFKTVVNFGENQPFKGAEMVYPTIAILWKDASQETFQYLFIDGTYIPRSLPNALSNKGISVLSTATKMKEWRFQSRELTELFEKIVVGGTPLEKLVDNRIYRGVTTGRNEAFLIDSDTRNALIKEDISSGEVIKPVTHGYALRPWYRSNTHEYLIFSRRGIDIERYPAVKRYLASYRRELEPKPENWKTSSTTSRQWRGRKSGAYKWYEIQDTVSYHSEFEEPKIYWAEIAKLPRFSWDDSGLYATNKAHFAVTTNVWLLSFLNSRVSWFAISQLCVPLRLRAGLWQYQLTQQFLQRLPVPDFSSKQQSILTEAGMAVTSMARERYQLHEQVRYRFSTDLDWGNGKLNTRLQQWWRLKDRAALRREVNKSFGHDIPVNERDEWEKYLTDRQAEHRRLTKQIIQHETRMNEIVYEAFGLDDEEIGLIEAETKYPYGAV